MGAFMSPYLLSNDSLKLIGGILLGVRLLTALSAWNLPESMGRDLGHTSLEDDEKDTETEGHEMAFRYDERVSPPPPPQSSTGIV